MIARINFAIRERAAPVSVGFSNGYRQRGDSVSEAVLIVETCGQRRPTSPDEIEAWQILIDSNEAWRRGETFAARTKHLIELKIVSLARRSYNTWSRS